MTKDLLPNERYEYHPPCGELRINVNFEGKKRSIKRILIEPVLKTENAEICKPCAVLLDALSYAIAHSVINEEYIKGFQGHSCGKDWDEHGRLFLCCSECIFHALSRFLKEE